MEQLALFPKPKGLEPTPEPETHHNTFAMRKRKAGYRPADHPVERCQNCKFLRKKTVNGRNFYKCDLIGSGNSGASDIRLKYVCRRFVRRA